MDRTYNMRDTHNLFTQTKTTQQLASTEERVWGEILGTQIRCKPKNNIGFSIKIA